MSEGRLTALLADLKVLDYGSFISAAYCTKQLADLGADVIKVEPPNAGDRSRRQGPFPYDIPNPENSGLFLFLKRTGAASPDGGLVL